MSVAGRSFRIALIQLGAASADKAANLARARSLIAQARRGADQAATPPPHVIVLPEIFNSPYGAQFFPQYAEVIGWPGQAQPPSPSSAPSPSQAWDALQCESETVRMLATAAKQEQVWLFGGSIPERDAVTGKLYNTATVYSPDGKLVALHRKLHLFDIDIPNGITFRESDTLSAGDQVVTIVDTEYGKIGLGICYDIRFPEMAMIAARKGCIAMIYPAAFNLITGPLHWELLARARAVDNQIYVATCSPARDVHASYHAWGHTTLVDPMGNVVATTEEKEHIVTGTVDIDQINAARSGIPVTTQRRFDVYPDISKDIVI